MSGNYTVNGIQSNLALASLMHYLYNTMSITDLYDCYAASDRIHAYVLFSTGKKLSITSDGQYSNLRLVFESFDNGKKYGTSINSKSSSYELPLLGFEVEELVSDVIEDALIYLEEKYSLSIFEVH